MKKLAVSSIRCLAIILFLFAAPLFGQDDGLTRISEEGLASWYGNEFHGRMTANGEIFDTNSFTAAHRTLPFGTIATVTNLDSGKSVQVRINDRGPFVAGRSIDLSKAAALQLGLISSGVARVRIDAVLPAVAAKTYPDQNIDSSSGEKPTVLVTVKPLQADSGLTPTLHTIQVASFASQENAQKLLELLHQRGLEAGLENQADSGKTRVVLRGIGEPRLSPTLDQLRELGFSQVIVRPQ